jgi:hypothetical protein
LFVSGHARISPVKFSLHLFNPRRLLAVGVGLCAAFGALAVSLGPNTHSAVLGQPLDLSIKVMLDKGDDPNTLCLDASVFYVDRQLDKSQVRVAAEKSANLQESVIRIRADAPVEGTVVTVHLRAGCVQQTMRRYVVLAAAKPRAAGAEGATVQLVAAPSVQETGGRNQEQEQELRQLRDELVRVQGALAETREQVQNAQSQGFRKELVFGVVGMLCFTFAGLLFLLRQRPRDPDVTGAATALMPESGVTSGSGSELGINESLFDQLKRRPAPSSRPLPDSIPPLARQDRAKFSVSVPFVPRTVRVPEIFDLQQQVEFFSSLGQQKKAISLLRRHLVDNVKTSALVYLDLLDLYHQTGDRDEYEVLRTDFNRVFKTRIAPFDDYTAVGSNVSAYEDVLARIEAVWPKRRVFDIIDAALFREPGNPAEVLDLEAYRELLLLHAVAREIIDLQADPGDSGNTQWPEVAMQPRSSPRLGLDIDLSEFAGSPPARERARAPAVSAAARPDKEPTVFDSLVDFDDYDTGFRPDGLGKS